MRHSLCVFERTIACDMYDKHRTHACELYFENIMFPINIYEMTFTIAREFDYVYRGPELRILKLSFKYINIVVPVARVQIFRQNNMMSPYNNSIT